MKSLHIKVPSWAQTLISSQDCEDIENAISNVEKKSSAEIVVKVIKRSSTVGHVPIQLATLLFIVSQWILGSNWFQWTVTEISPTLSLATSLGLAIIGAVFGSRNLFIERMLTSKEDLDLQVNNRALLEFYNSDIKNTKDSTGILIFISVMEHKVVVLADEAISKKFPSNHWDDTLKAIISGIKEKQLGTKLSQSISSVSDGLEKNFPITPDDSNELPNHLVFIED